MIFRKSLLLFILQVSRKTCHCFVQVPRTLVEHRSHSHHKTNRKKELNHINSISFFQADKKKKSFLYINNNEGDDFGHDDDDEGEYIEDNLGDWRTFRMNLAESGLPTIPVGTLPTESSDATETKKRKELQQQQQQAHNHVGTRPKSVSKQNENLLKLQNEKLANEYLSGVWAHEIAEPEVGSLVCRLPLEAELYRIDNRNAIGKKLREQLKSPSSAKSWKNNNENSQQDLGPTESQINYLNSVSFSPLAAQTIHWYKSAQQFIETELHHIVKHAEAGRIDPSKLSNESTEFLNLYMDNQVIIFFVLNSVTLFSFRDNHTLKKYLNSVPLVSSIKTVLMIFKNRKHGKKSSLSSHVMCKRNP